MSATAIPLKCMSLLGRWAMLAQRFGANCNCCDLSPELHAIEKRILAALRARHGEEALLARMLEQTVQTDPFERPDGLADVLRGVSLLRPAADSEDYRALLVLFDELDLAIGEAERARDASVPASG
jgi:hypothetical protein